MSCKCDLLADWHVNRYKFFMTTLIIEMKYTTCVGYLTKFLIDVNTCYNVIFCANDVVCQSNESIWQGKVGTRQIGACNEVVTVTSVPTTRIYRRFVTCKMT